MTSRRFQKIFHIFILMRGSTTCECAKGVTKTIGAVMDDSTAGGGDTASR